MSIDLSRPESSDAESARCYIIHEQNILVSSQGEDWVPRLPAFMLQRHPDYHFLGWLDDEPCYVCELRCHELDDGSLQPMPARRLIGDLDEAGFAMFSRALQFLSWQQNHRFCSRCGTPTAPHDRDVAMVCPACDYRQYPRITPCVIGLVTRGEYALLGRSERFPEGFFSCLAGFMEAGETAEHALAREVREETAIEVQNLQYLGSQSWPFPHSLMLGFVAEYAGGDICIDDDEIVEADWFHYQKLPMMPPPGSIARRLIDHWLARFE